MNTTICCIDGCTKVMHNKKTQLCAMHYHRLLRNGAPDLTINKPAGYWEQGIKCIVPSCSADAMCSYQDKPYCNKHRIMLKRHGTVKNKTRTIRQYNRKLVYRTIAEKALGHPLPIGAVIHHVNGNRKDNRPSNLVICPDKEYHALLHMRTIALGIKF